MYPTVRKTALVLALVMAAASVPAVEPVNTTTFGQIAIKGFDPVAYFVAEEPVKGKKMLTARHQGANWRFSSEKNLETFEANPDKYTPQYGGYCAWAIAQGTTASIDPEAWTIVDGKLYLNYNKKVQSDWEKDIPGFIKKADALWPTVLDKNLN